MNVFKKAYCRTLQFAFNLALPFLPFKYPEIIQKVKDIAGVIAKHGKKKPLIVTGRTVNSLGLTKGLERALTDIGLSFCVFDNAVANPTSDNVLQALEIYISEGCDCLVAFGGGSPMDCAKAVGALVARPQKSLNKLGGVMKVRKQIPLLIAVPTTAGSGSETTIASVIVDSQSRRKYAISDFNLIPSYAVLDEQLILSLPKSVAAETGMDALTHAIEAFIGRSGNKATRADALEAIRLIFENLETFCLDRTEQSAKNMLLASHKAGRAFTKSYVGYVHALAHTVGGKYDVPHGLANAIILPVVLREYGESVHKKLWEIAIYCNFADRNTPRASAAERVIERIEQLNDKLAIPPRLEGVKRSHISRLAEYADREANPLYPVPALWDRKKLESMYGKFCELS